MVLTRAPARPLAIAKIRPMRRVPLPSSGSRGSATRTSSTPTCGGLLLETIARACKALIHPRRTRRLFGDVTARRDEHVQGEWQRNLGTSCRTRSCSRRTNFSASRGRARLRGSGQPAPTPTHTYPSGDTCCCSIPRRLVQTSTSNSGRHDLLRCCAAPDGARRLLLSDDKAFLPQSSGTRCRPASRSPGRPRCSCRTVGDGAHVFTLDRETYTSSFTHPTSASSEDTRNAR